MSKELPFALINWIKREQEKEAKHKESMLKRHVQEDKEYMRYISFLVRDWAQLKYKEKELVSNFARHYEDGKAFTAKQRSAIVGIYMKYSL